MTIVKKALPFIILIAMYLVFNKLLPYLSDKYNDGCEIYHRVYIQAIKFKVFDKFTDEQNHNRQTVNYLNDKGKTASMLFVDDKLNLMYYNLKFGDSVIKKKYSMFYDLKSATTLKDSLYEYYVTCKDTIKAQQPRPDDK